MVYNPCCSQEQTVKNIRLARAATRRRKAIQGRTTPARKPSSRGNPSEEEIKRTGRERIHCNNCISEPTGTDEAIVSCSLNNLLVLTKADSIICSTPGLRHGGGANTRACTNGNCTAGGVTGDWVGRNSRIRDRSRRDGRGGGCETGDRGGRDGA